MMRQKPEWLCWTPERVICLIIIVGCMLLIAFGIDSEVKSVWGLAVAWIIRSLYQGHNVHKGGKRSARR
jgi:hypothetical protein